LAKRRVSQAEISDSRDEIDARAKRLLSTESADVLQYLFRRVQQREDSADLLGEAMLVVWKKRTSVPTDSTEARMWFFGIARRLLVSHYRGRSRREALASVLRAQIAAAETKADRDGTAILGGEGNRQEIRSLIAGLAPIDREIVSLVHWDGFSLAEVAIMMGISSSTVRSRYRRARARLRTQLDG
jgi:RNA polymerase sigma-70 factor (ECF subfamily)